MNQLAVLALGAAALLVHLLLCVLAVPWLAWPPASIAPGPVIVSAARWRARLLRPFLELAAMAAREPVRSDNASLLSVAAPVASLALAGAAAMLAPSFATRMLDWPLADLGLVVALLVGARLVQLLAAVDEGLASPGLAAVGGTVDGLLAAPGMVIAVSVIALSAGGTGLEQILAVPRGINSTGILACVAALSLAVLAGGGRAAALSQTLSGPDLALFRLGDGVQRLVWIDLIGALAWPGSLTPAQSGPLQWLLALLCWAVRLLAGAILLRVVAERMRSNGAQRRLAGLALLAALLGPILLLAGQNGE